MKSKAALQVEPGGPVVIEEIDIPDPGPDQVTVQHPVVGALTLSYDLLQLAAEPALTMITYTAEPGTTTHDNLSFLASWAASQENDIDQNQPAPSRHH